MSKVAIKYQISVPPEALTDMDIMPGVEVGFKKKRTVIT